MLLAKVLGNVWGARQARGLEGQRLLWVQPLKAKLDGSGELRPTSAPKVVVDALGAGPGELVLVAHGSRSRDLTVGASVPTKDVTLAIVDDVEVRPRGGG